MQAPGLRALLVGVVALTAITTPSALGQPNRPIDLRVAAHTRIVGAAETDRAGWAVAPAGDVNGDGQPDLIVGTPFTDNNERIDSGSAYVVFGRRSATTIDLADLGSRGFRIDGATMGDSAGFAVAGGADFNRDGRSDVIVAAPETDFNEREQSGSVYVVYGQRSTAAVDLANLGTRGFRIDGAAQADFAGWSVAAAGDVNRDGRVDILLGAPGADYDPLFVLDAGSAYVVFAQSPGEVVDLAEQVGRGFRIDGQQWTGQVGWSVARAGDVNGDKRADVLVGAPHESAAGRPYSGSAYVVFGASSTDPVDLTNLGSRGFRIDGATPGEEIFGGVGWSAAGAGDVNGDGRADVLVGATAADNNRRIDSGSAYLVYGSRSGARVDLARLGARGFRIDGATAYDYAGGSVAGSVDVNGDKTPDVLVSAEQADHNGRGNSGSVYAVFGKRLTGRVDLASLGERGLRVDGAAADDLTGWSLAGSGDTNGDNQPDLVLGAQAANTPGRESSGVAYIVPLPDRAPPNVQLAARLAQRLLTSAGIVVRATCDERCTLTVSVVIDAGRSPIRLAGSAKGSEDVRETVTIGLPASLRGRLGQLLRGGRRVEATVTVRAVDAAGNAGIARETVTVRR